MLAEQFEDKEWQGASHGEVLPTPEPEPPQPATQGLEIEPPPWQDALERGDLDPASFAPLGDHPSETLTALERMKLDSDDVDEPRPWAPPQPPTKPLARPRPPEPDWRAEEEARAAGQLVYNDIEPEENP